MLKYLEKWRSNKCLSWIKQEIDEVKFEVTTHGDKLRFEMYFESTQPSGYSTQEEIFVAFHDTFEKCVSEAYHYVISKPLAESLIVRMS